MKRLVCNAFRTESLVLNGLIRIRVTFTHRFKYKIRIFFLPSYLEIWGHSNRLHHTVSRRPSSCSSACSAMQDEVQVSAETGRVKCVNRFNVLFLL